MFGKASFNKTRFNKGSTSMALFVDVQVYFSDGEPRASALVDAGEQMLQSAFEMDTPHLSFKIPCGAVSIESAFDVSAILSAKVNLKPVVIQSVFEFDSSSLRVDEAEEFNLNGINLKPGDTLIIDTDTLEVTVNGKPDVEAWVSGGVFFQLKPGGDIITVYTNPERLSLDISVQWADRYL